MLNSRFENKSRCSQPNSDRPRYLVCVERVRAIGRTAAGVLILLLLWQAGRAAPSPVASNPFRMIVQRNVFGLRPPRSEPAPPPAQPLPEVVLTGLTTIVGHKLALLTLHFPGKPFERAKEELCTLKEGQREGPVEVLEIDLKNDRVKVNNSGAIVFVNLRRELPKPSALPTPFPTVTRRYFGRLAR